MKEFLCILFLGFSTGLFGQIHRHASIWVDEHTIIDHGTIYLSNAAGQKDYLRHYDSTRHMFMSSIPHNLTYLPAAGKELKVVQREMDYRDEYQMMKWELFSPERLDSLLKRNKIIETATLTYDEQGRLLSSILKSKQHRLANEQKEYAFAYTPISTGERVKFSLKSKELYWFGKYKGEESTRRPFRLKSLWTIDYIFDEHRRLTSALQVTSNTAGNKRVLYPETRSYYNYIWDKKGRMLQLCYRTSKDSIDKVTDQFYREAPFDLKAEQTEYTILKTPSIEKWLSAEAKNGPLKLLDYQGANGSGTYIVDAHETALLKLWKTETSRKILYHTKTDSNSIYRSIFEIYAFPDTTDKTPYNPDYQPHIIDVRHTQCSIETTMSRPPGLIDARSAQGFRKSYQKLNGGWTLIRYERGSSDGQTRFAVGYPARVRLEILQTKYVILDPEGKVQYFGSYRKMAKVNW